MAIFALVFFSCIILLSSAATLVDPNEVAEKELAELRQVPFDDCDFYGGDIPGGFKEHSTKEECRELCYNNYRCSHYTWAPLNGLNKCHLKDIGRWVDARRLSGAECGYLPGRIQGLG